MILLTLFICIAQLWSASSLGQTPSQDEQQNDEEQCSVARLKCAYRVGCGTALQEYMLQCAQVMSGRTQDCSSNCKRSLIALTSTEEGQSLMQCKCGDEFCRLSKQRVEVCRPDVTWAVATGTVVSCAVAKWICIADHLCSTALNYYNRFCRGMFEGHRCTARCNNSVAILNRQEKAKKLRDCYCDGTENFPCRQIKSNTDRLCFGRKDMGFTSTDPTTDSNEISPVGDVHDGKHHRSSGGLSKFRTFWSWWTLACLAVLFQRRR